MVIYVGWVYFVIMFMFEKLKELDDILYKGGN